MYICVFPISLSSVPVDLIYLSLFVCLFLFFYLFSFKRPSRISSTQDTGWCGYTSTTSRVRPILPLPLRFLTLYIFFIYLFLCTIKFQNG